MIFKLGQKVRYKTVAQKISRFISPKEFNEKEIVTMDKIKMVEFKKVRYGFVIGKRQIAKIAEYTFEDDNPDTMGFVVHHKTETIEVYKIAYNIAHTNYVLEKDLKRG